MLRLRPVLVVFFFFAFAGCSGSQAVRGHAAASKQRNMGFAITSNSFSDGETIPEKFTCDGENVSPQLSWSHAPTNTKSFALIVEDPDAPAGTWTHWVLFNIPASERSLTEGTPQTGELPGGEEQGKNDFGKTGYGGPCPPPGNPHRYFFKLYALSSTLNLAPGGSKQDLLHAMEGYILAQTEIVGIYKRK
jgi:Raf kinase inhibitor-like YbhB/YbcL family protein